MGNTENYLFADFSRETGAHTSELGAGSAPGGAGPSPRPPRRPRSLPAASSRCAASRAARTRCPCPAKARGPLRGLFQTSFPAQAPESPGPGYSRGGQASTRPKAPRQTPWRVAHAFPRVDAGTRPRRAAVCNMPAFPQGLLGVPPRSGPPGRQQESRQSLPLSPAQPPW